jgi:hypothetical protein
MQPGSAIINIASVAALASGEESSSVLAVLR